eukprot:3836980-Amphidinium_carterae.1
MGNTFTTRRNQEKTESEICSKRIHTESQHRRNLRSNLSSHYVEYTTESVVLTLAQLRNHSIYMSDIQSAFLNTPVQPGTTILVKPPPECEQDNNTI